MGTDQTMRWFRTGAAAAIAAGGSVLWATESEAASVLTATVEQSGYNGRTKPSTPLTPDGSFLPEVSPWDFAGQDYASLTAIESISVRLFIGSGDSLPGEINYNELTLALDGYDTGIKLNGDWTTTNNGTVFVTEVFTGPILNAAEILAALKVDGKLAGTILDSDPGDDFVTLGSTEAGNADTTLVINGIAGGPGNPVPTPTAAGAGLAALAGMVVRRRRR